MDNDILLENKGKLIETMTSINEICSKAYSADSNKTFSDCMEDIAFGIRYLMFQLKDISSIATCPTTHDDINQVIEWMKENEEIDGDYEPDMNFLIDKVLKLDYSDYNDSIANIVREDYKEEDNNNTYIGCKYCLVESKGRKYIEVYGEVQDVDYDGSHFVILAAVFKDRVSWLVEDTENEEIIKFVEKAKEQIKIYDNEEK